MSIQFPITITKYQSKGTLDWILISILCLIIFLLGAIEIVMEVSGGFEMFRGHSARLTFAISGTLFYIRCTYSEKGFTFEVKDLLV